MKRLVRHADQHTRNGRPCHHLLFALEDGRLVIRCNCGADVEFTPADLRRLAYEIESPHVPKWEIVLDPAS